MYAVWYLLKPRPCPFAESNSIEGLKVTSPRPVPHLGRAVKGHVPARSDTASTPPFDPPEPPKDL